MLRARKSFQRMVNYCIFRASSTIHLITFFFFAILTISPNSRHFYGNNYSLLVGSPCTITHGPEFTLPVTALMLITLFNDWTMLSIAYDHMVPAKTPQRWCWIDVRGNCDVSGSTAQLID